MATATSTWPPALLPAPTGYVLNFDNPQRKGDVAGYWVFGVGMVLSFAFLSMRVYTKAFLARMFGIEDVCLCLAWCFGVAVQAILIHLWLVRAVGVHAWEMSMQTFNYFMLLIMSASVLYVPCLGLAKFSLLLFYYKLSPLRWFKTAVYIVMTVVVGYSFAIIFALIFPCQPIAKNWDVLITKGTCINRTVIYITTAVVNIATDLTLLTLPIPMILKLQMPRIQKFGLIAMFTVGSLTCVTSIIRLVVILPSLTDLDATWALSIPCIWIVVEANLVIICGSLPVLRLFFRHVAPKFIGESSGQQSGSYPRKHYGGSSDLQTFGSKPSRAQRSRSTYVGMDKTNDVEMDGTITVKERQQGGEAESDGGSETHIVQTTTTTVEYSQGPFSNNLAF